MKLRPPKEPTPRSFENDLQKLLKSSSRAFSEIPGDFKVFSKGFDHEIPSRVIRKRAPDSNIGDKETAKFPSNAL